MVSRREREREIVEFELYHRNCWLLSQNNLSRRKGVNVNAVLHRANFSDVLFILETLNLLRSSEKPFKYYSSHVGANKNWCFLCNCRTVKCIFEKRTGLWNMDNFWRILMKYHFFWWREIERKSFSKFFECEIIFYSANFNKILLFFRLCLWWKIFNYFQSNKNIF